MLCVVYGISLHFTKLRSAEQCTKNGSIGFAYIQMRKSTKPVLQTSMFLSAFSSHRGSLRAQGIGKGGGEGVRAHPTHARVFFLFHVLFKR